MSADLLIHEGLAIKSAEQTSGYIARVRSCWMDWLRKHFYYSISVRLFDLALKAQDLGPIPWLHNMFDC